MLRCIKKSTSLQEGNESSGWDCGVSWMFLLEDLGDWGFFRTLINKDMKLQFYALMPTPLIQPYTQALSQYFIKQLPVCFLSQNAYDQ